MDYSGAAAYGSVAGAFIYPIKQTVSRGDKTSGIIGRNLRDYLYGIYASFAGKRRKPDSGTEYSGYIVVFRLCRNNRRIFVPGIFFESAGYGISTENCFVDQCGNVCADPLHLNGIQTGFLDSDMQFAQSVDFCNGVVSGKSFFEKQESGGANAAAYLLEYTILLVGAYRIGEIR